MNIPSTTKLRISVLLDKLVDIYLYGNLHIALCATLFTYYTFIFLHLENNYFYLGYMASGTLSLYTLHRIIGIDQLSQEIIKGRFTTILFYRKLLIYFALASGLIAFIFFLHLSINYKLLLIFPGFIASLYILPVFGGNRRMRDFPLIKIFMIAIVWAYLTVYLPALFCKTDNYLPVLFFLSRALFVFSITIPFDIRDFGIDKKNNVDTIVHLLGVKRSKVLAIFTLSIALWIMIFIINYYHFQASLILIEIPGHMIPALLIIGTTQRRKDAYFTFWLDGTMMLFWVFYFFLNLLSIFD